MSKKAASAISLLLVGLIISLAMPSLSTARTTSPDFVEMAKRLKPTVVNIRTAKVIKPRPNLQRPRMQSPFDNFFEDFFGQFNGQMPQQRARREQSLGTGFIISPDGYILTNNHVVSGADEVMVKFSDGREIKGEIKGADEKLDLALIKVSAKEAFHAADLGDSDVLEVGEWVMAIGNPFGLSQTVTAGIVSAKGRVIGNGPYDDFIQTDASINPGNSGGPLFSAEGKVIGINTAIIAGGQGIGFAIPINLAKGIIAQLRDSGKVTRGYLGVRFQPLTADLAKSFGLESEKGALIAHVEKDTPAEKAGLKAGDVILEYDGKPVNEGNELPRYVADTPIDKKVKVVVFRDGKKQEVFVVVGKLKGDDSAVAASSGNENEKLGITVQDLTVELAARLNIKDSKGGLVISEVKAGSPAEEAGTLPGSLIVEINGQRPDSLEKYSAVVSRIKKGDIVRLLLKRPDGSIHYVAMKAE
jgi:serine protease Do